MVERDSSNKVRGVVFLFGENGYNDCEKWVNVNEKIADICRVSDNNSPG